MANYCAQASAYFNYCSGKSGWELLNICRDHYRQLEDALSYKYSDGAFFATMRVIMCILAADAKLTNNEYELFKHITNSSPTYEELYNTCVAVSKDFDGALNTACSSPMAQIAACRLAIAITAYKGWMSEFDLICISNLSLGIENRIFNNY